MAGRNARRRDDGNDFAVFRLAGEGSVRHVEVDTSYFVGNAPGWVKVSACRVEGDGATADAEWWDLVERTRSLPDTRHRLDVYPDGGLARLRVWGELTDAGLAAISSQCPS